MYASSMRSGLLVFTAVVLGVCGIYGVFRSGAVRSELGASGRQASADSLRNEQISTIEVAVLSHTPRIPITEPDIAKASAHPEAQATPTSRLPEDPNELNRRMMRYSLAYDRSKPVKDASGVREAVLFAAPLPPS